MAKPIPSSDQLAALNAEITGNSNQAAAMADSIPLQDPIIAQKQKVDDAFKALFDYYNLSIIGKYDAERKAINGTFIAAPVVEADIVGVGSNPPSGRLIPSFPSTDILRIPEFDSGAYTSTATNYEQKHISDQANIEDALVNGYGAGAYPITLTTSSAITPTSTTLQLEDSASAISMTPGTIFLVSNLTNLAVVKVLTVTPNNPPTPPPYQTNLTIELLVAPASTIPAGQGLTSFTGFTNSERTAKVATNPNMQSLMDFLIAQLESIINDRISRLNEQLSALAANEDVDGLTNITTAINNANNSKSFLNNYLTTTLISDSGLASLSSERSTRSGQLTARLSQILAAYTGQTENYYEQRYQTANNRGNTSRGTLRAVETAKSVKVTLQGLVTGLAAANAALNSIIP